MALPVNPSTSSKATGPGPLNSQKSTNVPGVRLVMRANNIPIEDEAAIENNPEVRQWAEEIVDQTRNSPERPQWQVNFKKVRDKYAERNESTWINMVWGALHNPQRNIRDKNKDGSILAPGAWTSTTWEKSFLDQNWDADLRTGSVPKLYTNDPNIQEMLDSLPRITNPRPDIAFGLERKAFSEDENTINDRYQMYAQVSQGIYHSFLVIETKTNGTIEDTENQCSRGGASLVCAARIMIHDSDPDFNTSTGPDMQSMAFSVALVPTVANIFCHWAEVKSAEDVVYHMHLIKSFALRNKEGAIGLHRAMNNILDWGTGDRKSRMKEVLRKIHERTEATGRKKRKNANGEGDGGEGQ